MFLFMYFLRLCEYFAFFDLSLAFSNFFFRLGLFSFVGLFFPFCLLADGWRDDRGGMGDSVSPRPARGRRAMDL